MENSLSLNCPACQHSLVVVGNRKLQQCCYCGHLSYLNISHSPFLRIITPFQARSTGAEQLLEKEGLWQNELPKLEESKAELVKSRKSQQKTRISTYRILIMNILILMVSGFLLFKDDSFRQMGGYLAPIYGALVFAAMAVMVFFVYQSVTSENTIALLTSRILDRKKRLLILQSDLDRLFG